MNPIPGWRQRLTLTVPEAGALLGLGRSAAYAAAGRGEIPTLRLGSRVLVPVPKLLELVGHRSEITEAGPSTGPATDNVHVLTTKKETPHGAPSAS